MELFFFRSVRLRIFLLYTLILFVTFSLFSSFIYLYFRHEIYRKVDVLLDVKAHGLEDAVKTYLKTKKIEETSGWASLFSGFGPKEDTFSSIADYLTEAELAPKRQMQMRANIFDASNGKLIASTNKTPPSLSLDPVLLKSALAGQTRTYSFKIRSENGRSVLVRAVTRPVTENGKTLYIVQATMSLKPARQELEKILRMLVMLVLLTLLIASWAGFLLVKITLRPVDLMVAKMRSIRSDNLSVRVDLPDANDEIRRLANTFNEMLERIDKSFEAQREIVQDISHELKTPLTILRGHLEVALKKERTPEEYVATLHNGLDEIESIRKIIDNLLMLARLDARAVALEMKKVPMGPMLESLLEDARALAGSKNIEVVFRGDKDIFIQGNEIHLRRLFMNLLENAVKYTSQGGRIELEMHSDKKEISVSIRDNGAGISAEHLPHVFDRFYRAEKTKRREGHGLGLSIVKSIVDVHKGRIEVESEPGKGTLFRVMLPKQFPMTLL